MKNQKKIGAILGYVHIFLNGVIGLLYVPFLLNNIGQAEYGLYQIVSSVMAYIAVLEATLSASVIRYYTVLKAKKDEAGIEHLLFISRRLFRILSLVLLGLSLPIGFFLYKFYQSSLQHNQLIEMLAMFGLLIFNVIISVNNYIYLACITVHERFVFLKIAGLACLVMQPITVVLFLKKSPYAIVIVLIHMAFNALLCAIRFGYAKKVLSIKIGRHKEKGNSITKEILVFSTGVLLTALADQIFWKTDQLLLGKMIGVIAVAIYSVGAQIFGIYMSLANCVTGVLLPTVVNKVETQGVAGVDPFFRRIGRIQFFILGAILGGFVCFGQEFLLLWVGEGYEIAYYVVLLLIIPYTVDLIQATGLCILQAVNKYAFRAKCLFIIAIINIVLTVLLVGYIGIVGAALSTAVSILIGHGVIMNVFYKRVIGLNIKQFWKEMAPIFAIVCISILIGLAVRIVVLPNAWLAFLMHGLCFVAVYGILSYLVMNSYEKMQIKGILRKILKK